MTGPHGQRPTESFRKIAMPRMTNPTCGSDQDPDEILRSVARHLRHNLAAPVDSTHGKFASAGRGVLTERQGDRPSRVTRLQGPDALTQVTMIGNDMALDRHRDLRPGRSKRAVASDSPRCLSRLTIGGNAYQRLLLRSSFGHCNLEPLSNTTRILPRLEPPVEWTLANTTPSGSPWPRNRSVLTARLY